LSNPHEHKIICAFMYFFQGLGEIPSCATCAMLLKRSKFKNTHLKNNTKQLNNTKLP